MDLKQYLQRFSRKQHNLADKQGQPIFIDLTPIDDADKGGEYEEALKFAIENPRIKNIALSGPHGSGKSSIIKTFQRKNEKYKFLNISLASFQEDEAKNGHDKRVDSVAVERSILQQMLYGVDATKLPFSRFKRIATPKWPWFKSTMFGLWLIATYYLSGNLESLFNLTYFSPLEVKKLLLLLFVLSVGIVLLNNLYKATFGISLKKISLKNAEFELPQGSEGSILNHHLDEIIYFFQQTNYDVVVIEDLDRFGDPEIFVKLREINKLINDNDKTSGQTKFLYALKDDMFLDKNRAKFFDFIIPVIPIINTSNSLDKMQERLGKHDFAAKVDKQFLRDVSLYLDDMRLIQNIFNEFVIYYRRLKSESLNVTKLLAIMIYKNVYPSDFEDLHHRKGALYEICSKRSSLVQNAVEQHREKISNIKFAIESSRDEQQRSTDDLTKLYMGQILSHTGFKNLVGIVVNNTHISFSDALKYENFKELISASDIQFASNVNNHPNYRFSSGVPFSQIEEELNPGETYLQRKQKIENKSNENRADLERQINELESQITKVSQLSLNQLFKDHDEELLSIVEQNKIRDEELLLYLIRKGYIDESYHFYTSNFHEGRITNNDRDYLLSITSLRSHDPNQVVDTPKEVCVMMRAEDFQQKYVLNINLIDYLVENYAENKINADAALQFIMENFEDSEEFLASYYTEGKFVKLFVQRLCKQWPAYAFSAINSPNSLKHISFILQHVDAEYVVAKMNRDDLLASFLSEKGHQIISSNFHLSEDFSIFKQFNIRFPNLEELSVSTPLLNFAIEGSLFEISPENIRYIFDSKKGISVADTERLRSANYSTILDIGSQTLQNFIDTNLSEYVKNVLLIEEENVNETEAAIKIIINNDKLADALKAEVISKQNIKFDTFQDIPHELQAQLFTEEKIALTWKNISHYLKNSETDAESFLLEFLEQKGVIETLTRTKITESELGEKDSLALSRYIINNDEFSDQGYCLLLKSIPRRFANFPENISIEKLKCFAAQGKVGLSEKSYSTCEGKDELAATLIGANIEKYFSTPDKFEIDSDIRGLLISSDIPDEHKLFFAKALDTGFVQEHEHIAKQIGQLLISHDVNHKDFDSDVLQFVLLSVDETSDMVKLFTKCIAIWNIDKVMEVMAKLPRPYNKIATYGKHPSLSNTPVNQEFAAALKANKFISTFRTSLNKIRINTFKWKP